MTSRFEQYIQRVAPSWLNDHFPPDDSEGNEEDWAAVMSKARDWFLAKASYDFAELVMARGWRPHEVASGQLDRGAVAGANGGVRRLASASTRELQSRSDAILQEARRLGYELDPLIAISVEGMANGSSGSEQGAIRKLEAAEEALRAERFRREAKTAHIEALPVIEIGIRFSALGRAWEPGRHRVTQEDIDQLDAFVVRMEQQRDQHGWDRPSGFEIGPWPPFVVLATAPEAQAAV